MSEATAISSPSHGATVVEELRKYYRSGKTKSLRWRLSQLHAMKKLIEENEEQIARAITADLGKPRFESFTTEVSILLTELDLTIKQLSKWMKPERVKSNLVVQPASSKIYREPLGVTLVLGAWNYPLQLALGPAIGAIAAGNCVVIKPSEVSANTSAILAGLFPHYMDQNGVKVVEGGIPETTDLLAQKWDYIFYTGNGTVGRIIMSAAAKHLTPVTLELGGKSPAIIDKSVDLRVAARRIAWGKFTNAGQTCVAPDYLLVHESLHDALVAQLKEAILEFFGESPIESEDYGRIINERHHDRLVALLGSGTIAHGGAHDKSQRFIAPTLLTGVSADSAIMSEEIFGPLLPILPVPNLDAAIDFVNDRDKPLALYIFTKSKAASGRVIANTSFGGGCINHVLMHLANPHLPFGGVGKSGMGGYHGRHSFELFSHKKSILDKPTLIDPAIVYPPYSDFKKKVLKRLL